jgi:cell wall-associated NlpC family hydrolase
VRRPARPAAPLALLAALAALVALLPPSLAGAPKPAPSWAQREIAAVVSAGLLAPDAASFRADDSLTRGELAELAGALTGAEQPTPAIPDAPVTLAELDARLVRVLGLSDVATRLNVGARAAGLAPPGRFGSEVVARLLGLRTNHPAARDALELRPNDPVTRAETAFSVARLLRLPDTEASRVRRLADTFVLPELTPWQRKVLGRAFSFVGYPYVWGGESESRNGPYGPQAQGGFDCSGFVWRVYKIRPYPDSGTLADTLRGRTTYAMSGEVPAPERVPFDALRPGDVVFFGSKGPASKPAQVDHMGIYAGAGWLVHASGLGTTLTPLEGWYRTRFAWARRPLAEAGLEEPAIPLKMR